MNQIRTPPSQDCGLLLLKVEFGGAPATALVDTGANNSYVSQAWLENHPETRVVDLYPERVTFGNDSTAVSSRKAEDLLRCEGFQDSVGLRVLDLSSLYDIVLGTDVLDRWACHIDVSKRIVRLKVRGRTHRLSASSMETHVRSEFATMLRAPPVCLFAIHVLPQDFAGSTTGQDSSDISGELRSLLDRYPEVCAPPEFPPPRPPHLQHQIRLTTDVPINVRQYRLSPGELAEVTRQMEALLKAGLIEKSASPYNAPLLCVKKANGTIRVCVDFRKLNEITIKDTYPMPRIDDLFDRLGQGAQIFSALDLASGFHQMELNAASREYTGFVTPLGKFHFKVMPFGLCTAPQSFQRLADHVLAPVMFGPDRCAVVYIDDILIYSPSPERHVQDVRRVLDLLREHKMHIAPAKCVWGATSLQWLGHRLEPGAISPLPARTQAIREFPAPRTVTEVRRFLGMVGWYRRFIRDYAHLALPLNLLTRGDTRFGWSGEAQMAFDRLKKALTEAPCLHIPDPRYHFVLTTDGSGTGVGAVLSQDVDGVRKPVAFFSRQLKDAERNYQAFDLEMLAVADACRVWRHYLVATRFTLETDHQALLQMFNQPFIRGNRARWLMNLMDLDFDIAFRPGVHNEVSDALSRATPHMAALTRGRKDSPPALLEAPSPEITPVVPRHDWVGEIDLEKTMTKIAHAASKDDVYAQVKEDIRTKMEEYRDYSIIADLIYFRDDRVGTLRLWVPEDEDLRRELIASHHDHPVAGHRGIDATARALEAHFLWPKLWNDVREWVKSCPVCATNKPSSGIPGPLHPLPVPYKPFDSISMDLMDLPRTPRGHDTLFVVVCRFSKMVVLTACDKTISAEGVADLLYRNVICYFGVPLSIVSDRDTRWTAEFFGEVSRALGVRLKLSSANHPQTDGQTENTNRTVLQKLRALIERQTDWDLHLDTIQLSINTSVHASLGETPADVVYGRKINTPLTLMDPLRAGNAPDWFLTRARHFDRVRKHLLQRQDKKRAELAKKRRPAVKYAVGDAVLIKRERLRGILPDGAVKKLTANYVGPYRVTKVIFADGSDIPAAVHVDLGDNIPGRRSQHPAMNVADIKKGYFSLKYQRSSVPPLSETTQLQNADGEAVEEVQAVLSHRYKKYPAGKVTKKTVLGLQYQVQFVSSPRPAWLWRENIHDDVDPSSPAAGPAVADYWATVAAEGKPPKLIIPYDPSLDGKRTFG